MDNRIIPSFIQELLEANIIVSLTKDSFIVEGFYKSGSVEVKCQGESDWFAIDRYKTITPVDSIDSLVALNYDWWQGSKNRYEGWSQPDCYWAKLLVKFGYIKAKVLPERIIYE